MFFAAQQPLGSEMSDLAKYQQVIHAENCSTQRFAAGQEQVGDSRRAGGTAPRRGRTAFSVEFKQHSQQGSSQQPNTMQLCRSLYQNCKDALDDQTLREGGPP